ncbi:hypothetical protein SISNIDRAFT_486358 [Sistotremastrum niveocremeum HHB9708]|uniref:Uncharacterized protein n=1 Tax=Sistotremastrum niveocremeum HHB9708 TaxID=1314777 RepID=A0A164U2I4_9AGAM|nr:hypothetical protein SISNIDRAFT_486358 [Sistotremastrum niveocremeum HHB9708]
MEIDERPSTPSLEDGEVPQSTTDRLRVPDPVLWATINAALHISTPNAHFIPSPPLDSQTIQMRSDGRYGHADHGLSPQYYSSTFPHLAYLPKPTHPQYRPLLVFSNDLGPEDIETIADPARDHPLRRLRRHVRKKASEGIEVLTSQLDQLISGQRQSLSRELVRQAFATLKLGQEQKMYLDIPMPWGSLLRVWGTIERLCQEIAGFIEYGRHLIAQVNAPSAPTNCEHHLVGAFTRDASVLAQLYFHGVPVWYISTALPKLSIPASLVDSSRNLQPLIPPSFSDEKNPFEAWADLGSFNSDDPTSILKRREYDASFTANPYSYRIQDEH